MSMPSRETVGFFCTILVGVITTLQYFGIQPGGLVMPLGVNTTLLVGILINLAVTWWFWRSLRATRRSLADIRIAERNLGAVNTLKIACNDLLRLYKYLDHDYRGQIQYPLSNSSVPQFGAIWEYVDVELATLKSQLDIVGSLLVRSGK